jgi:hypothetical protein
VLFVVGKNSCGDMIKVEACRDAQFIVQMQSELLFMVLLLFVLRVTRVHLLLYSLKK